jgi:ribosomal protein S14
VLRIKIKDVKSRYVFENNEIDNIVLQQISLFCRFKKKSRLSFRQAGLLNQTKGFLGNKVSFRNLCILSYRSRGIVNAFSISRLIVKKLGSFGQLPGFKRHSW